MDNTIILEACVESLEEAIYAERHGAHRLELCANLDQDGTTPDVTFLRTVLKNIHIPVKVMIRPRGGNFVFSESEFQKMLNSIRICKSLGVTEIVTGILNLDNTLDVVRLKQLTDVAAPMSVTVHKCIDLVPDIVVAIHQLKQIRGITSILSSGQARNAKEGAALLKKMLNACGERLTLIVAGKVTQENLAELIVMIGAKEFHGRRIV